MKKGIFLFLGIICLTAFTPSHHVNDDAFVVVIDAGHGGKDTGVSNENGLNEKLITLSIATEVERIGRENGLSIILSRSEDKFLTLQERVLLAKNQEPDLFISLHVNHHNDPSRSGIDCYTNKKSADVFSSLLLKELNALNGMKANKSSQNDFYVLKNNQGPAVMLELGYLSNASDASFISNSENQKAVAAKIVASLLKYRQ